MFQLPNEICLWQAQEGHNAERFDSLYGSLPRIRVPKILWEYTWAHTHWCAWSCNLFYVINHSTSVLVGLMHSTSGDRSRRVLTMEWIEGIKLTDERGLRGYGMRAVDFVDLGVDCTMRQLLEHGKSIPVLFCNFLIFCLNFCLPLRGKPIAQVKTALTLRHGY